MTKAGVIAHGRLAAAAALSDGVLLSRVRALAERERAAIVDLVAHLGELDSRKLYRGEGFASLFAYCTSALRLSEHGAYNRIEAARAARKFPAILDLLADGSLNLATLRRLAPHLTAENCDGLFAQATGKSKRDVELLVAGLAPRPDVASSVRKLPTAVTLSSEAVAQSSEAMMQLTEAWSALCDRSKETNAPVAARPPAMPVPAQAAGIHVPKHTLVEPLAPERFRVQFTVGKETRERLRRVQDLLRREIPDGDVAAIFDRALALLLAETERKKLAATTRPRAARHAGVSADPGSRHIPAQVKRAVWKRDGGQCAFVAPSGNRCKESAFLEFHHQRPWAAGGQATETNISLRCRSHNIWESDVYFGRASGIELVPGRVASSSS